MICSDAPDLSVAITSFNRKELLFAGLEKLERQSLRLEVVVADDGSTDGTAEELEQRFPGVRLIANRTGLSRGVSRQLIAAYAACSCSHVASFDEDFHLTEDRALETLLEYFDDPRVAIVAVPFRDALIDDIVQQAAPAEAGLWQRYTHIGNGALVDLAKYREVGGYPDWNDSYIQEEDLALRLLDAGYIVRVVPPTVQGMHWRKSRQLSETARFRSARNDVVFYWKYAPAVLVAQFILLTSLRNLVDGFREASPAARVRGLLAAPGLIQQRGLRRSPVSMETFRRFRSLKRLGPQIVTPREST